MEPDARPAGAFLPPQLASRAGNLAAPLGLVRARTLPVQIPTHGLVQQVQINAGGKHGVGQLHLAYRLTIEIFRTSTNRHDFRLAVGA